MSLTTFQHRLPVHLNTRYSVDAHGSHGNSGASYPSRSLAGTRPCCPAPKLILPCTLTQGHDLPQTHKSLALPCPSTSVLDPRTVFGSGHVERMRNYFGSRTTATKTEAAEKHIYVSGYPTVELNIQFRSFSASCSGFNQLPVFRTKNFRLFP